jgi:hypothetical protein
VQLRPGLKVLLTSGFSAQIASGNIAVAGEFPMLPKPYRRAELAMKLQQVLRRSERPRRYDA